MKADQNKKNKRTCGWICSVLISVVLILLLAIVLAFIQSKFRLQLNVNDTILMFVGILATFIVVSNYAQVKEIKDEYNDKVEKMQDYFSDQLTVQTDLFKNNLQKELDIVKYDLCLVPMAYELNPEKNISIMSSIKYVLPRAKYFDINETTSSNPELKRFITNIRLTIKYIEAQPDEVCFIVSKDSWLQKEINIENAEALQLVNLLTSTITLKADRHAMGNKTTKPL